MVRLTRFGAVFILVVIACGAVFVLASGMMRALAGLVGCVLLLAMAGEGLGSGLGGDAARKQEVLRAQARPRRRPRWRR